ncbi:MAG: hypothetical protein Q9168_006125 [Polycauliona sp. 1 TL-2023]
MPLPVPSTTAHPPAAPSPQNHLIWTTEREERLVYVSGQLSMAQARWSEEQELWIEEGWLGRYLWDNGEGTGNEKERRRVVDVVPHPFSEAIHLPRPFHTLEDLKRECKRAEKKAKGAAGRVARIWKARTWGSSSSLMVKGEKSGGLVAGEREDQEEDEGDDIVDGNDSDGDEMGNEERPTNNPRTRTSSLSNLFRTISLTNKRRNTLDNLDTDLSSHPPLSSSTSILKRSETRDGKTKGKGKGRA